MTAEHWLSLMPYNRVVEHQRVTVDGVPMIRCTLTQWHATGYGYAARRFHYWSATGRTQEEAEQFALMKIHSVRVRPRNPRPERDAYPERQAGFGSEYTRRHQ